ncbi:conserved exported hypothetical protein [Burkholderiales bacterium]|nr:conserved exported hypothetical protein [Burkholderiales bacterium]
MVITALLAASPAGAQTSAPPHAWLFGAWIGGLFPPPSAVSAQECLAQPVVIFTRDIVMRATLTDQLYTQRLVETARSTGSGFEFRFAQSLPIAASSPFSQPPSPGETGFGCENPDVLHVQRRGENEISFLGCPEFPYPLVRCPAR